MKKEIGEESSALATLRGEENILRESISSLESRKVVFDSKLSDIISQIKTREEEYHKMMETKDNISKELKEARKNLYKYKQGFRNYDDLNAEIVQLRNTYDSLDEEYRKKSEQVEYGFAVFNLLTDSGEYHLEGLKLLCGNLVELSTIGDSDFQKMKMKAIETLIGLTRNSLVVLSSIDGGRLKIKFVRIEDYDENIRKFMEIERMKEEG